MNCYVRLWIVKWFLTGVCWFFNLFSRSFSVNSFKICPEFILNFSQLLRPLFFEIFIQGFDFWFVFKILKVNFVVTYDFVQFIADHYFINVLSFINRNNFRHGITDFQHLIKIWKKFVSFWFINQFVFKHFGFDQYNRSLNVLVVSYLSFKPFL